MEKIIHVRRACARALDFGAGYPLGAFIAGHALCALALYFPDFSPGLSPMLFADKIVHFCLFAMLALCTRPLIGGGGWRTFVLSGVLYGLFSESVQELFIHGREFSLWDVLADCIGCGVALFSLFSFEKNRNWACQGKGHRLS